MRNPALPLLLALLALVVPADARAADARAPLPPTDRLDLRAELRTAFRGQWLHDRRHVPQSFASDDANGFLYVLQVEGTNVAGSFEEHSRRGELTLTKLTRDGRTVAGHMTLRGFSHGVALGVEPIGDEVFLWTEVDAQSTDAVIDPAPVRALTALVYREPEGLAVQVRDGTPHLCLGFGATMSVQDSRRQFSLIAISQPLSVSSP